MNDAKYFPATCRHRAGWLAVLLAVAGLAAGPAVAAEDTSLDEAAKKTGQNFGELLKGMGQELKKAGGSLADSDKQGDKQDKPPPEKETDKGGDGGR